MPAAVGILHMRARMSVRARSNLNSASSCVTESALPERVTVAITRAFESLGSGAAPTSACVSSVITVGMPLNRSAVRSP